MRSFDSNVYIYQMINDILMYAHLVTIVPCIFIGGYLMLSRKGNHNHKKLGKIYLILMLATAVITSFITSKGPRLFNHFGFFHFFSLITFWTVPNTWKALKVGNIRKHKFGMIGLYVGGILIAGAFTFAPGRYLHNLFFA